MTPEQRRAPRAIYDSLTREGASLALRPIQADILYQAQQLRGCFCNANVGTGKTLPALLVATVIDEPSTVVFTESSLIDEFIRQAVIYDQSFAIALAPRLVSYGVLSSQRNRDILDALRPKAIVLDEAHCLSNPQAARTRRLLRYLKANPDTRLFLFSGTLTRSSIDDYAHLMAWALRQYCPVPTGYTERKSWSLCIDTRDGAEQATGRDWARLQPLVDAFGCGTPLLTVDDVGERQEIVRDAYYERLHTTPGVILTDKQSTDAALRITRIRSLAIPEVVRDAMIRTETTWVLPEGEEVASGLDLAQRLKELALGFYYYWDWPGGQPDRDWLFARSEWHKQVRLLVKLDRPNLDTLGLVTKAVERGINLRGAEPRTPAEQRDKRMVLRRPDLAYAYEQWREQGEHKDTPPTKARWLSYYLIDDCFARVRLASAPVLVWYSHDTVAETLANAGFPVVLAGQPVPELDACGVSRHSHFKGLNLQHYGHNIVLTPSSSGAVHEQLIGRTHRDGQTRDSVGVEIYTHTDRLSEALDKAIERARYAERTTRSPMKLLSAEWSTC